MGGDRVEKKKLLVTGSTFPRWKGDTEPRFVLDLSEALTEYFDVTALVPAAPGAKNQEVMNGVKVIRYHYFPIHKWETLCYPGAIVPRIKEKKIRALLVPFLFLSLYWHLFRLLPKFDVVHAHWIIPQGIVQSFFKKPYIVTGHGGDVMELNSGIIKILKARTLKKASFITVVSEKNKATLEKLYATKNVIVQSMGCDTEKFTPTKRVNNYFGQGNKKVVLFVGRFVEIKGIRYLLEAMEKIDAKLVIVGKGPLENEIQSEAEKLEDKVILMGPQDHEKLPVIYASSDVFVIPSITINENVTEGAPTVITEALASGLPVIGTNTGGIPEMIENNKNGFVIPEKDANAIVDKVNYLLSDEIIYQNFSKQARMAGEKKSYKNTARAFGKLLKKI